VKRDRARRGPFGGPLAQLIRAARPPRLLLSAAAASSVLAVASTLAFPMLTKQVVDQIPAGGVQAQNIALLALALTGAALASALTAYLLSRVGYGVVANLRRLLVRKVVGLPIAAFDRSSSGDWVSRVLNDCQSISDLVTREAINLLTSALLLAGSITVLFLLDLRLTLMLLGSLGAAFLLVIPLGMLLEGLARGTQDRTARLGGILTHVFAEIRLVKAFTAEAREHGRSDEEIEGIRRIGLRQARINVWIEPLMTLALMAAVIAILVYGATRVSRGDITIGTLTAFVLYILNVATPVVQLTHFTAEFHKAKGASTRIAALLQEPAEDDGQGSDASQRERGDLVFRDVSFAYPGGEEMPVLRGIDLVFRPGTTTALVGASGNGKTTILSLIERFYRPSGGAIEYDGEPIERFSLGSWRGRIGYVAQGAPVMPGSVRDNITYGLSGQYSDAMVWAAAERAGAAGFIERMPEGLDTALIEQGNNLSGGQRQRIAIARMFLRNPDILILDEATSALDSETEHQVKLALAELMKGRTNIVVAHSLTTVMQADCIYFLEGGRISGMGNHEELNRTHPYYARLVARYFQKLPEPVAVEAPAEWVGSAGG
jgi:ATP-binding cassette subfamily B protein AbcA/BmrA